MILLIDTTKDSPGNAVADKPEQNPKFRQSYEYINASGLNISHCLGCNYCWLKTPGECAVKDDYVCSKGEIVADGILCSYQVKGE